MDESTRVKGFAQLQEEWYNKLAEDGFEDLEWVDHTTGKGQNSDYIKKPSVGFIKTYNHYTEEHFRIMRHYLNNADVGNLYDCFLLEAYSEGLTYREIKAMLNSNFNHSMLKVLFEGEKTSLQAGVISVFPIFIRMRGLINDANEWNKTSEIRAGELIHLNPNEH